MLSSFTMKGFRSIQKECTIELKSTNYKILSRSNVSNLGILKGCLLVGPNGSGKSNIQGSLKLLLDLLFTDTPIDFRNYFCLFDRNKRLTLSYQFLVRSCRIRYEIEVEYGKPMMVNEKLFVNDELCVERIGNNGRYISDINPVRATQIGENELFVHELYTHNIFTPNKVLSEWMDILSNSAYVNVQEQKVYSYMSDLTNADLDKYLDSINQFFADNAIPYKLIQREDKEHVSYRLSVNGRIALPLSFESNANRFLIKLLPVYLHTMQKGGLLILDEFHCFHPNLAKVLIGYFEEHTKHGQIIVSSCTTSLLNANVLRADQLYSVNDKGEGTTIMRFSDKQPRELQNMEKMYFNNIFDGLPPY